MRKLTLIFIFISALSLKAQKIPTYREVSVCGQEGMANNFGFLRVGEQEYISIIKNFEKKIKKHNNYSGYYRLYILIGNKNELPTFYTFLIPKELVSEEDKKIKEYRIYGDNRTLKVYYDLKTKKISQPKPSIILPDL
ncbi:hypothetical protein BAX97_08590 [Elizabethkingia meningoseptica]|uniref:hypothetical protein n=1 Tax=Elizabethkingia meningoseptica TaxID=238 RepID=UPI000999C81B|nr:hypothetical protein [Elizabethkingia meningoseptica]OPC27790.1 hypothetical protein BAX97_08590 [Elizabethkingia meningoseptica]